MRDWLTASRELTRLTRPFLVQQAERSQDPALAAVLQPGHEQDLRRTLKDLQVVDVLQRHRGEWDAKSFVQALRPLAPRLYSIASSPEAVGDEAHLTVAVVDYEHERPAPARRRVGVPRRPHGEAARARVFIEHNERFRLPADTARDVIMIGPGTGVAPFRGFVQHREAQGATGRNWLFFGARHFQSEFLYQARVAGGASARACCRGSTLAFSRDRSTPRTYVQDRLRAAGKDALRLARGRRLPLRLRRRRADGARRQRGAVDIVAEHGAKSRDDAEAYVRALADERRYLRDVY